MNELKTIWKRNDFHARIFIFLLYFEKKYKIKLPFKILRKIIIQGFYCSYINPDSFIDVKVIITLRLPHPYVIIINRTAKIGHHCTIFHEVTIGVIEKRDRKAPVLGNNVYVSCKSGILGNVKIGDNAKIGAGSIVLKDVKENTTVVGLWK